METGTIIFLSKKHNGGYGDRLVGMSTGITIARMLGFHFQSTWEDDFMRVCEKTSGLITNLPLNYVDLNTYNQITHPLLEHNDIQNEWKGKMVVLQANRPAEQALWKNPYFVKRLESTTYEKEAIQSYNEIFTKYIRFKDVLHSIYDTKYEFGIQIRCGDTYCMPHQLAQQYIPESCFPEFAKQIKEYILTKGVRGAVYVTSDARVLYEHFQKCSDETIQFVFWNREEDIHFDFYNSQNKYAEIMRDHISLQSCRRILTGLRSNFGTTAAYSSQVCQELILYESEWKEPLQIRFKEFDVKTMLITKEYQQRL